MPGQLTIFFSGPGSATPPPAAGPDTPQRGMEAREQERREKVPPGAPRLPRREMGLPTMRLFAGYEMYRDECRTVIRKPREMRWTAAIRTGPTTHRFVGAGPDPAALWQLAAGAAELVEQ